MLSIDIKDADQTQFDPSRLSGVLINHSSEGFLAVDLDQRYRFWSRGMERITGLRAAEVLGKRSFDIFPFLKDEDMEKAYERAFEGLEVTLEERPFKIPQAGRSGYFSARYSPLRNQDSQICGVVGVIKDVTQERLTRELKQETEDRFRNMADCSPVMLWMAVEDGMCNFFNTTWLQFTGRRLEQEIGVAWAEGVHFEDFQNCMDTYMEAFNARRSFEMEYRLKRADGEYRWILDRAAPRYSPDGTFAGFIGSCVDITERKQLEQELRHAVSAREEFLSIASHELKTPLTSLSLQLGLLQHVLKDPAQRSNLPEKVGSVSNLASRQIKLLSSLIENLLDVSRAAAARLVLDRSKMDLVSTVSEVVGRHAYLAKESGSSVEWIPPEPLWGVWDKLRIEQVISNLLSNAIKYGQGKPVTIRLSNENDKVTLRVRDHGIGIAKEHQTLIFEKFQRFKISKKIEGLGLGLFIAKQIVDSHGGKIGVDSELGLGCEFFVELPAK